MTTSSGLRLLLDGDILLYSCAFAAEKVRYCVTERWDSEKHEVAGFWDNHKEATAYMDDPDHDKDRVTFTLWSRKEIQPVEFAIHATNTVLESLVERFAPSSVDVYLSDSTTYRHRLATTKPYKGNRSAPKPVYYDDVKEYLLSRGAIIRPDIEADDCLAIEATKDPANTLMVTVDKDLMQVPGKHYNWKTQEYNEITKKSADFSLATQLLTGDTTDNIPGLPKCGPVAAKKLLEGAKNTKDLFGRVFKAYEERVGDGWADYFCEQFGLIYLLRSYDQKEIYSPDSDACPAEQIRTTLQGAA